MYWILLPPFQNSYGIQAGRKKRAVSRVFFYSIICNETINLQFKVSAQRENQCNSMRFGGKFGHQNPRKRGRNLIFSARKVRINAFCPL